MTNDPLEHPLHLVGITPKPCPTCRRPYAPLNTPQAPQADRTPDRSHARNLAEQDARARAADALYEGP